MNAYVKASAILSAVPTTTAVTKKLANDHVCTTSEAAELNFEPEERLRDWKPPTAAEWNDELVMIHLARKLILMTKPEMMKFIEDFDSKTGERVFEQLGATRDYFSGLYELLNGAETRFIITGSTVVDQSEKSKRKSTKKTARCTLNKADPILAAISDHRRLKKEWDSVCAELDEAEGRVEKEETRPFAFIAWRNYSAIGGSEIRRARDEFLRDRVASPKQIEREYKDAKARERATHQAQRDWYKRNGLADLKAQVRRASHAERNALMALTSIRPTTSAGAGALIAYIRLDMEIGEHPWQPKALANASRALLGMPNEALPSFEPDVKDLDLSNAAYEMRNVDGAIDRLHKKHGDDADGRKDYHQLEAKRDEALNALAKTKSVSSNGLIAKAEVLVERRLIEDYERHRLIATSLAKDVLHHFGVET